MKKRPRNYAFIDNQNIFQGVKQDLGWSLGWQRFRTYLRHKYGVTEAYQFLGFVPGNQRLYDSLQAAGYRLVFKPVLHGPGGKIKGNCDADLVLRAMVEYPNYGRAVIVSSDGDFYSLVEHRYKDKKLETVLAARSQSCSSLLKQKAKERIQFLDRLRAKLERRG